MKKKNDSQSAKPKRKLVLLAGAKVIFKPDFKMTEEELLGLNTPPHQYSNS